MDYKELIERFRAHKNMTLDRNMIESDLKDAADAIETLLAERDAAVKDLTSVCEDSGDSCPLCKHFPCAPEHEKCLGWEWRGPQKGEPHGE